MYELMSVPDALYYFALIWIWAIAIVLVLTWFGPIIRGALLVLLALTLIGLPIALLMLGGDDDSDRHRHCR